jgi:GNAT superfamily N-acetyltransferase
MTDELDIHAASPEEVAAAHRNVFDIWSKGLPLDEHVRYRLNSPTHGRAQWFVGCVAGRVVVSLGGYPVRFCLEGRELRGIAIGSVYTVSDMRGKGYAPRLIAWVENQQRSAGGGLSVLYSDIEPQYYARQGYVLCPSFEGWRDTSLESPPSAHALTPFDPHEQLASMRQMYASYHGAAPLSIARDDAYWTMMLEKFADDAFYALPAGGGAWAGYVRVGRKGDAWRITDYALAEPSDALAARMHAELLALARACGAKRVGGWLPDSGPARALFALAPRRAEITMIKPLDAGLTLSSAAVASTSRFCELDHV